MGSGKTKLGRELAEYLNLEFIDQDRMIEFARGCSITEIFSKHGEHRFREMEREILMQCLEQDQFVLATGGGAPCYMDQIDLMNAAGRTVYLKVPQHILLDRLRREKTTRPLIARMDDNDLQNFIAEKLSEREFFYRKAQIQVDPASVTSETLAQLILQ